MSAEESIQVGPYTFTPAQLRLLLGGGHDLHLLREAAYSVALDRDGGCRTVALEDLSPQGQDRYAKEQAARDGKGA